MSALEVCEAPTFEEIATFREPRAAREPGPLAVAPRAVSPPPAEYRLPRVPYLRLRCTFRALGPAFLPSYHGSLLRGAFGHALRRAVCAMGAGQECLSCRLRPACLYTRLFETFVEGAPSPLARGLLTSPRPYVFEPGTAERSFAPGDALPFDLLLLGQAAALAPYARLALERMAAGGLGARRVPFALDRVAEERGMAPAPPGSAESEGCAGPGSSNGNGHGAPERVLLRFVTPTRIPVRGALVSTPGFRVLAFAMLRRVLEVAHAHVPEETVDWEFRSFLRRSEGVRVAVADLRWVDQQRLSQRQKALVPLGGFVGTVELAGELAPFVPLFRAAEVLHVGKGATFGLGRVVVSAL